MVTVTEKWGVVDAVREAPVPGGRGWLWAGLLALFAVGVARGRDGASR